MSWTTVIIPESTAHERTNLMHLVCVTGSLVMLNLWHIVSSYMVVFLIVMPWVPGINAGTPGCIQGKNKEGTNSRWYAILPALYFSYREPLNKFDAPLDALPSCSRNSRHKSSDQGNAIRRVFETFPVVTDALFIIPEAKRRRICVASSIQQDRFTAWEHGNRGVHNC